MSDTKAIAKASRSISQLLGAARQTAESDIPVIIDRIKQKLGGVDKLADMLLEDLARVRGEGLTEEERLEFVPKEQVIQRYYQMLLKCIADKDASTPVSDLSMLSEEDLRGILAPLAIDLIKNDSQFREQIADELKTIDSHVVQAEEV